MALKEHPHVVTTSYPHDKDTIQYDKDVKHRSKAVGKVYKINNEGKAELPADGEAFDGIIIAVDDTDITGAYICGGLIVPLAKGSDGTPVTVARGDNLVAGVDASDSNAKGFVKAVSDPTALPADIAAIAADGDIDTAAEARTAANAKRTQINSVSETVADLIAALKGNASVLDFDTTHALITL